MDQLKTLFEAEGPLKKYGGRVIPLISELEPLRDIRDFLAHGFCRIEIRGTEVEFIYKMLRKVKGGEVTTGEMTATLEELTNTCRVVTSIAERALPVFREIYLAEDLERFGGIGDFNPIS